MADASAVRADCGVLHVAAAARSSPRRRCCEPAAHRGIGTAQARRRYNHFRRCRCSQRRRSGPVVDSAAVRVRAGDTRSACIKARATALASGCRPASKLEAAGSLLMREAGRVSPVRPQTAAAPCSSELAGMLSDATDIRSRANGAARCRRSGSSFDAGRSGIASTESDVSCSMQ